MTKCTNRDAGNLLHGYEIGILSEEECGRFETHLLECEYCHDLLISFQRQASLLKTGKRVRAFIEDALPEEVGHESALSRIWRHLWPNAPLVLRPAVVYVLVLLLAIPAYQGLRKPGLLTVTEFKQSIHLSPTRAAGRSLKKSAGDIVLVTFQFDGYRSGGTYQIVIKSEDGAVVYCNNEFSGFDEREIGSLSLAISEMEPGKYRLIISDLQSGPHLASQEYLFSIEKE